MSRLLGLLSLAASISFSSGCAMCCHPFDCHYPYQGGRWVRDIPDRGRVGSAFEEAGHRVDDVALSAVAEPTPAELPAMPPAVDSRLIPRSQIVRPYLPTE